MTVVCKEQRLNYKDECVQLQIFIKCVTCHFLQTVNVGIYLSPSKKKEKKIMIFPEP